MMSRSILFFIFIFAPFSFVSAEGCYSKNTTVFSCSMNKSSFYVCYDEGNSYYKHYVRGVNDFTYPTKIGEGFFYLSSVGFSGGGEVRIEFNSGSYLYSIYGKVVKVGGNGGGHPDFKSGIKIEKTM